jgi:hypothetical protein
MADMLDKQTHRQLCVQYDNARYPYRVSPNKQIGTSNGKNCIVCIHDIDHTMFLLFEEPFVIWATQVLIIG